jgi:hypothetical protein
MQGPGGGGHASAGFCWVDLLLALAIVATTAAMAVPLTARSLEAMRARDAAGILAARIRLARQQALTSSHSVAVVFDQGPGGWELRICTDANGNGIRRLEISSGTDPCPEGPWAIATLVPGMAIDVDPSLPGPAGDPSSPDPVRFGRGNMASCSSSGACSPGTLFLRSASGDQYAVRVAGVTGRTRVLRFDRGAGQWVSG